MFGQLISDAATVNSGGLEIELSAADQCFERDWESKPEQAYLLRLLREAPGIAEMMATTKMRSTARKRLHLASQIIYTHGPLWDLDSWSCSGDFSHMAGWSKAGGVQKLVSHDCRTYT